MTKLSIMPDYNQMSDLAANRIISCLRQKTDAVVCLAGGHTPLGTYKQLIDKVEEQSLDLSQVTFVGLDEWIGINGSIEGSCRHTLDKYVYRPLKVASNQIVFFDGTVTPIGNEKKRVLNEINKLDGIDFMLLGIGMNGHLGFNEPHVSMDEWIHVVSLDEVTKNVSTKYFDNPINISKGITLGLNLILSTKNIIAIANGEEKADIIAKTIQMPPNSKIPSSLLKNHDHVEFIFDKEAAKKLDQS
ncbi:glucosamine-6-phosphate deaminase [Tuberibacillus sp. Marseille-P3662]|uniref:glucosamine-6-phosphate deaminase n=1 Tax=Tuberibacillus sp. Marseille-P3662 TaxID=1965358 RepID=UPI000A1CBED0|nr:glucosamine-6-phosphate deaminase [Tuberibacillus sp. Marseille-P3662]